MSLPVLPCQAIAVYSWSGEQDSDLGMIEGDRIDVLDFGDGNWWFGKLQRNKMAGVFPKNFVKILEIQPSSSRQSIASSQKRATRSPTASPRTHQFPHSRSHQQLTHSISQQFYQDSGTEEEGSDSNKFSYQSSNRFSAKKQPKYFSTNDISRYTQGNSSPMREEVSYLSDESKSEDDNEDDFDDEAPPPPPPKTSRLFGRQQRSSLRSSYSTSGRSSQLYDHSTSSVETPPPKTSATMANYSMLKNSMQRSGFDVSGYSYQQLYDSLMSNGSERSMLFGHSNFSATSAGSLARHKDEQEQKEREAKLQEIQLQGGLQNFNEDEQVELLKKIFVDKKQSRHPKLLKKLFSKDNSKVSLDDQIHGLSINEPILEVGPVYNEPDFQIDPRIGILNETTLSPAHRSKRQERVINENPYFILKPFDGINSNINYNEIVTNPSVNVDSIPLYHVDKFIRGMPIDKFESIESIALNSIAKVFKSDLEKIRAIYCFCTERIELVPVEYEPMDRRVSPKMTDVIYDKRATPYQLTWLFKAMANALHIKTDIVLGHFKFPFKDISASALSDKLLPNHSWLSMVIEGQWRMIDVVSGNLTNELFESLNLGDSNFEIQQMFYFLTKPLDIIHTHVPIIIEQQHISPPIDTVVALSLPPSYASFSHYGLKFHRFNNSLTYMKDLEICELQIEAPCDVEVTAKIQCDDEEVDELITLSQPFWYKNRKIFVVRAVLPPKSSIGFIKIFVGDKKSNINEFTMCSTIQLCHQGTYKPLSFVKRYPTIHTLNQDLLVSSPQTYDLKNGEEVEFIIQQHPSFQVDSYNKHKARTKLALQSPSGNITKFEKVSPNKVHSDWTLTYDINETGLWRGLVLTDDGARWSIFCEWKCT